MLAKAAPDVAHSRAIVFPVTRAKEIAGRRIFPFGVVEVKETACRPWEQDRRAKYAWDDLA